MLKHAVLYKPVLLSNLGLVDWTICELLEDNTLWWYNFDCSKMEKQMLYSLEFGTEMLHHVFAFLFGLADRGSAIF